MIKRIISQITVFALMLSALTIVGCAYMPDNIPANENEPEFTETITVFTDDNADVTTEIIDKSYNPETVEEDIETANMEILNITLDWQEVLDIFTDKETGLRYSYEEELEKDIFGCPAYYRFPMNGKYYVVECDLEFKKPKSVRTYDIDFKGSLKSLSKVKGGMSIFDVLDLLGASARSCFSGFFGLHFELTDGHYTKIVFYDYGLLETPSEVNYTTYIEEIYDNLDYLYDIDGRQYIFEDGYFKCVHINPGGYCIKIIDGVRTVIQVLDNGEIIYLDGLAHADITYYPEYDLRL